MRRKKPDWVLEQDRGTWRLYVGAAVILTIVALVVHQLWMKRHPQTPEQVVQKLLEEDEE